MTSEERFKHSLEDLLNKKEFSFDEANWDKAKDIIDASKKRRRRVVPYFIAGLLMLGSLIVGVYFLFDASSATDKKISQAKTTSIPSDLQPYDIKSERPPLNSKLEQDAQTAPALPSTKASVPVETHSPAEPEALSTPALEIKELVKIKEINVTKAAHPMGEPMSESKQSVMDLLLVKAKKKSPEKEKVKTTDSPQQQETIPPPPGAKDNQPEEKLKNEPTDVAVKITNIQPSTDKIPVAKKPSDENFASDVTLGVNSASNKDKEPQIENESPATAASETTSAKPEEIVAENPAAQNTSTTDTTKSNPVASEVPADNAEGELGKTKEHPILFSIEAGANYMFGWKNPVGRDANGFTPVIGINYFNNFKSKMALTVGLQYTSVNKLNFSNYTSKVVQLALGEESQVSIFTPTKVQYLIMPLRFDYSITPKNSIGIGCNIAYLFNVTSDVETYSEKMGTRYDESHSTVKGYTKGFKQYDTQVALFYKRRLIPNLALNMEFYYGLTDVKDNTFFNSKQTERNTGLKLTLVYNFLKK